MATQHRPTGRKPGPVPKGARKQFTIRFPDPQYATLTAGQEAAGYENFGDYVVAFIAAAQQALVTVRPVNQPLPLSA